MKDKNTKQRRQMIKEMKNGKGHWGNCCIPTEKLVIQQSEKEDALDLKPTGKCRLYVDKNDNFHFPVKELNFLQAFIILVITLVLFTVIFPLAQRAMDIQSLHNCELRGDCSEVIKNINK